MEDLGGHGGGSYDDDDDDDEGFDAAADEEDEEVDDSDCERAGACLTGLPTSVLGYEGSLPSGAFNRLGLVGGGGGGTAEQVELVLLWLFS